MGDYEPMDCKSKGGLNLDLPSYPPPYSDPPSHAAALAMDYPPEYPPLPSPRTGPKCRTVDSCEFQREDPGDPFSVYSDIDEYLVPGSDLTATLNSGDPDQEQLKDALQERSQEDNNYY